MEQPNESTSKDGRQTLKIWCCERCEAVHFKAGNVLLNFTKAEFAELTYSINDVFQNEFGSSEFYHLISSLKHHDEVLASDLIS